MLTLALLATALLFGGMVLFSFGFAAFLLNALPPEVARRTIRHAFPHFYLFVIGTASTAAALLWPADPLGAGLIALIAVTTVPARQILMPAINRATDTGSKVRFKQLHGISVMVTLVHIGVAAYVLVRFAGGIPA